MTYLKKYIDLIERFLSHKIPVHEFERLYLETFKYENHSMDENIFELLDWLFAEVDAYTDESTQDQADYINEEQLRESARKVLSEIKESG